MSVHIYLDVDGVLNAVTSKADPGWGWGASKVVRVNGYSIRYSPAMVATLNRLAEHVDFFWLTTWREDAPTLLAPAIGLRGEHWPVLDAPEPIGALWWKLTAIRKHIAETSPSLAIWIDDDIAFDQDASDWVRADGPAPICPKTEVGLERDSLAKVLDALTLANP